MVCWAPSKEQHTGLCCALPSVVVELAEAAGHCAHTHSHGSGSVRGEEHSLELQAGGSTQTCPAEPPTWASGTMTDQQQAAKSGGLQQRHSLLMISETVPATSPQGHSFHPLLQCQSHSSTGLAANDLLITMVQRSPAQEGTCRGWDTGPAVPSSPEEYTMQPRGTQGSDTPRPPCCLLLQPIGPLKAAGWTGSPQTPPSSCRHQYGCPSTLLSQHCAAGPPKAGESHPQGIPSPVPAPAPLPAVCVAVVACMEMAMSVA